ncbi:MAG: acyltransferase [Akkermansia sp.]|nr:acyltransferase [Akkermansia sp.]
MSQKKHFLVLDGLRGVAALIVVWFHIFEAFANSHHDYVINHGYLAVDFFFILSGFVIAYSYDDRWKNMGTWEFAKRRLIRLQPMVVLGALMGSLLFYTQHWAASPVGDVALPVLLVATLLSALMIPLPISADIRGYGEMYPVNGPAWSLLFEYIGNFLYAVLLRRLSTLALGIWVALCGLGLATYAIFGPLGDICVGFSMTEMEFLGGLLRVLFSFAAGLLLFRVFRPLAWKRTFLCTSVVLTALLFVPRLGGESQLWLNGGYESFCVLILFPLLVWLGASGEVKGGFSTSFCKWLGAISFPLYIIHYPFIYTYLAWVKNHELSFVDSLPGALGLFFGVILLASASVKFYDLPVRNWLNKRFTNRQ